MKVAVACDGTEVSGHFGRCQRYLLAEVADGKVEILEWLENPGRQPEALPELMRQKGVKRVLAGGAGPRAVSLLAQSGIELIPGLSGDAQSALQALAEGTLVGGESTCDH